MPTQGQVQRNKRTGEMRVMTESGWQPHTQQPTQPSPSVSTVNSTEPDTYWGGVAKSIPETVRNIPGMLADFGKGYMGGAWEGFNPLNALSGLGRLGHNLINPEDMQRDIDSVIGGLSNPQNYTPENIGRVAGGVSGGAVLGRAIPPVASATKSVVSPVMDIAQEVPQWAGGGIIKAGRTALPEMLTGVKKSFSDGRPQPRPVAVPPSPDNFRMPRRTSSPAAPAPQTPQALTSRPTPMQQAQAQGQFGGDRSTGSFPSEGFRGLPITENLNTLAAEGRLFPDSMPSIQSVTAGSPDIPGLTIGKMSGPMDMADVPMSRARQAAEALQRSSQETPVTPGTPALGPNVRKIPRFDQQWGPGSVTKEGLPSQAGVGRANAIYDPQTPTPYLREQLGTATDAAERAFLAKALSQRSQIDRARAAAEAMQRLQDTQQ